MAGSGTLRGPATSVALLPEGCDRGQTASSLAESVSEVPRRISDSSVEEEDLRVHASPTTPHASCCHSSSVVLVDGTLSRNGAGICRSNGDEERLRREGSVCPFDDTRRGGYKEPEGIIGAGGDRMGPSALDREPDFVVDSHRVPTRSPSGEVVEATAEGSPGPELQGLNRRERSVVSAARRDDATSLGFVGNDGPLSVGKANGGRPQFASLEHDGKTCDGHTDTRVVQDAAFAVPVLSPSPPHAPLSCRPLTPTLSSSSRTSPPPTSASLVSYIKHSLQRLEKVAGSTRKPKGLKEACCRALGAFERLVKRRERTRRLFRDADGWSKAAGISSAGRGAGADCLAELEKVGGKTGEQRNSEQAREQSGEDCSGTVKSEETIGEQRALAEGEDTKPPVAAHGQEQQKPPQGGQPDPAFTAGARAVAQPGEGDRSVTTVLSSQHGTESHSDLGVSQAAKKGTGGFVGSAPHAERQTTVQGADMKERSSFFVEMDQTEESAVEVEDLESMFEPFQLACESNNPRLQYPALEGLHRILVTNFLAPSVFLCPSSTAMSRRLSAPTECLEGETVELPRANDVAALAIPSSTVVSREETQRANCVQCPRDNQPCSTGDSSELLQTLAVSDSLRSPQIPPSSVSSSSSSLFFTTRQTDSDSSPAAQPYKQDQQLDSSPAASTKPPLIDRVAAAICKCSESADEPVVLQALRCLLTAVSSPYLELHGGALLSAVRALFEVFGNCQRSAENQRTAQAALLHTVRTVMQRYECGAVSSFPRESLLPERALRARASYCSASGAREREDPRFSRGEPWGGQGERGLAKESTPETVTGEFAEGEARNTEEVVLSTGKAKKRTRLGSAGQEEQDTAHTCAARKEHADDSVPVSGVTGEEAGSAFAGCSADQLIGDQGQAGSYKEREDELQGLQSRAIPEERPTGGGVDAVLGQRTRTVAELSVPVAVREQSGPSAPAFSCPSVTSCGFPCSLSSTPPPRHPASSSSSFASPLSQGPFQRATTRPSQSSLQLRDVLLVLQALCRLAACEDPSGSTGGGSSRFTGSGFVGSLGSLVGGGSGGSTKFGGDGGRKATKKLALELTRDMLQASGERLRSSRLFLSFLKQHLFVTLIRSVVVPSLCAVSLDIFLFLVQRHYHHLGHETAVFFSELLVRLLLSPNIPMDQREVILSSLAEFFVVTPASFTLGLFLDFDCSVEEKDVVLPLLETLCSQAVKPAKGDDDSLTPGRLGGIPSQASQPQLRRVALKALVSFLQQLREFIAKVDTRQSAPAAQGRSLHSAEGYRAGGTYPRVYGARRSKEVKVSEKPASRTVAEAVAGQDRETTENGEGSEEEKLSVWASRRRQGEAGRSAHLRDQELMSERKEAIQDSAFRPRGEQPSSEREPPSQPLESCVRGRSRSEYSVQYTSFAPSSVAQEVRVCDAMSVGDSSVAPGAQREGSSSDCAFFVSSPTRQERRPAYLSERQSLVSVSPVLGEESSRTESASRGGPSARLGQAVRQRERKSALKRGIQKFNLHPRKGFEFLANSGLLDASDPMAVARFLMRQEGLSKTRIGEVLGDGEEFSKNVLHAFVDALDFRGREIDSALKAFLQLFRLPGEAQKIDRIMEKFAEKFYLDNSGVNNSDASKPADASCRTASCSAAVPHISAPRVPRKIDGDKASGEIRIGNASCIATTSHTEQSSPAERNVNAGLYECADCCYVLAFSLIMLHTDAHSPEIKPEHKMSKEDFVRNNRGINNGKDVDPAYLETLYERIVQEEWTLEDDDLVYQQQQQFLRQQEGLLDSDADAEELVSLSGSLAGASKPGAAPHNWLSSLVIPLPPDNASGRGSAVRPEGFNCLARGTDSTSDAAACVLSCRSLLQHHPGRTGDDETKSHIPPWGESRQHHPSTADPLPPGFREGIAAATAAAAGEVLCGTDRLVTHRPDFLKHSKKKGGPSGAWSHKAPPDPKDLVKKSTQLLLARLSLSAKKDSSHSPSSGRARAPAFASEGGSATSLSSESGKGPCSRPGCESRGGGGVPFSSTASSGASSCLWHSSSSELAACAAYMVQLASWQLLTCFASALGGLPSEGDPQLGATAVLGLDLAARLCMTLNLKTQRNAFVVTLSCLTYLHSAERTRVHEKNIAAVRALLSLGLECGDYLEDAWLPVLQSVSQLDFLHVVAHDVLQKAREIQQQRFFSHAAGAAGGGSAAHPPSGNCSTMLPPTAASPCSTDASTAAKPSHVHGMGRAVLSSASVTKLSYARGIDRGVSCPMSSQGSHRPAVGSRRFLLNSPATQPDSAARRGSADLSLSASSPEAKAEEAAEHHRDATSSTGAVPPQVCPEDPLEEKPPTPTSSDDGETIRRQARLGVSSEVVVSLPPRLPSLHPDADLVPPCPPDRPCGRTGLGRTTATGAGQQRWGGGQHQISSSSRARETPPACSEKVALPLSYTPSNEPSLSGVSSMTSFPPPLQSQQDTVSPAGPSIVAGGFLGLGTSRGALHPAWNSADRFAEGGEQRRVSQDTAVEAVPLGLWLAPPTQVGEPTWISLSSISSSSLPNVTSVLVENALVVSKGIDSSLLDLLFNQSRLLSAGAIIYFVSSLCRVSREELCAASCGPNRLEAASSDTAPAATRSGGSSRASQGSEDDSTGSTRLSALANRVLRGGVRVAEHTIGKGGEKEAKQAASKIVDPNAAASPRIFSLQKLVEVAHFNMDRIRFVWSRVWSILRHHFADACLHPCLPVRLYAIDSLRQLTTKFLEKDELAQFTFQSDFLKPFLTVMTHPETEEETKEFLIHILFNLVQCQATNIRSGWKTVLQTVHAAAQDACASLQGSSASTSGRAEIDTAAVGGGTSAAAVEKRFLLSFQVLEHILAGSLRALWQGDSLDEAVRCLLLFSSNPIDGATALKAIGYLEIAAIFLVEGRSDSGDGNVAAGETRRLLSALPGEQDEGLILRNIHRLHETLRMERQEAVAHLRKIRRRRRAEGESPNSRQGSRFPVNESEGNEDSKGVDCDENSKEVCPALNQLHPTEPGQTYARGTGFEESQECCGSFPSEEDSHEDERRCSERSVVEYEVTEVSSGARCSSKCKPPGSAVGPWVSAQTESDVAITDCGEPSHLSPSQSAASPQTFQSVSRSQSFSSFPRHSQGISDAFFLCVPLLTALAQLSCSPPCLSLVTTRKESFPHRVDPSGLHGSGRIRPIAALDALFRLLHTYGSHFIPLRGTRNDAFCPREGDKERGEQPPVRKGEDRARVDNHAMCGRTSHGDPPGSSIGKAAEAGRGRKEGEPQSGVFLHQECGTDESGLSVSVEKERFLWTEGWQRERGKAVWKMIFRGLLFPLFDDLFLLLHLHFQQSDVRKDRSGSLADKSKSIQSRSPRQSVIPVPAGGGKDESSPQTYNPRAGSFQVLSAPRVPEVCPSSEGGLSASKGSTPSSSLPFCDRRTSQAAPPPGDWPAASSFSYGGEVRPSDRSTRQETSIVSSVVQGGGGESILSSSGTGTITEGHELPVTGCQVSPTAGQLLKVGGERGLQRCPSKSARALLSASDSSTAAPHQKLGGESSRFLSVSLFSPSSKYSRTSFLERQESSLLICRDDTAGGGGAWIEIASWSALQQLVSLTNLHLDELQFHLDEILTLLLSAVEDENAIEGIARLGIEALSQLIRSIGPKLCRERGRGKPNGEEKDWNERDVTYSPGTDESVSEDRCIPLSHQPGMATVPGRQDGGQCTRDEFEDGVGDKEERDARVLSCRCREIPMTHTDSVTRAGEERRERGTLRVSEGREDEGGSCCRGGRRCGGKEAGQDRKEETDVVQTRADTDDDGQDVDGDACWETLATAVLMLFRRTTPVALFGSQIISAAQLEKLYGVYFGPIPLSAPFQQEVPPKVHAHGNGQSGALAVGRDKANMGGVCFSSAVYRSMGRRRFNGGRFSPDLSDPNSPSTLDGTSVSPVAPSSSSTRAFETSSEDSLPLPLRSASSVPLSSLRTSLPSGSVPCPAAPFHNDLVHDEESTAKAELDTGIPKKSNEARNARRRSVTPGNGQEGRLIPNSPGEPFPRPLRQVLLSVLPSTVMSSWGAVGGEDGHRVSEGQKQDKNNRKPTRWGGAGGSIGVLPFKPQHVVTQCIAQLLLIDILQRIIAPLAPDLSGSVLSTFLCCLETSFLFGNLFNQQIQLRHSLQQRGFMSGMRQLPGLLKQVREGIAATMSLLTSVFSRSSSANNTTAFSNPKHGSPSAHFPPAVVEDAFPGVPPDGARMKMVEAADRFIRVSRWLVAQYLSKERELRALRVVKEREQRQQDQQRTQQTRGAETGWAEPSKASCLHLLTQTEGERELTGFATLIAGKMLSGFSLLPSYVFTLYREAIFSLLVELIPSDSSCIRDSVRTFFTSHFAVQLGLSFFPLFSSQIATTTEPLAPPPVLAGAKKQALALSDASSNSHGVLQ